MPVLDALTILPPFIPLLLNAVNRRVWPRAEDCSGPLPRFSVLVPARNEEDNIATCVRAALAVEPPVHEVIVCDDDSTDGTAAILERLAKEDPRLRVIAGTTLPDGWVGKPHACHQLGRAATGDHLLFVDADTTLTMDATRRLSAVFERYNTKVITAFPHQVFGTAAEALIVPMLAMTFTSWMPLDLIWKHVDPRFLIVNGQVLAFRREAYETIGGFEAVKSDIVDDMAICRRAKELDQRVIFIDGQDLATTRMYRGVRDIWQGFSKNFFIGLGSSVPALVFVLTMYFLAYVFPFLRLGWELLTGMPSVATLVGVGFALTARGLLARRFAHPWWTVLLLPVAGACVIGIGVNSALWSIQGRIAWRGRTYASGS